MVSDTGPRKSLFQGACNLHLSLAVALSTIPVTIRDLARFPLPHFEGKHNAGGHGPSASLPLPPTLRKDLWLEGPMLKRHYKFTNIHAFSGTRTETQRYCSQRH
ncbi:hypothetical protein TNCV_2673541 [Trichonephila clavipes]|nr:hypothetical protein TNCV_2673541 [Trichonephila clavipes]